MNIDILKGSIVKLLISIFLGFPLSFIYRKVFIQNKKGNEFQRNLYTFISGFFISIIFNGKDFYHTLVTLIGTYLIIQYVNPKHITLISWLFNFGYLLISYYMYSSTEYDLNWLTPQSIICLRLIGLSMDYSDGQKKGETKKSKNSYTGLTPPSQWPIQEKPELLEMLGYCYFYGTSIAGPQFSFKRYKKFISLELFESNNTSFDKDFEKLLDSSLKHSIKRFILGILYNATFVIVSRYFSSLFLLTEEFTQYNPLKKFVYIWIAGKYVLFKYFGIWMLVESQCILNMIQFDGLNSKTNDYYWNAINNIDGFKFSTAFSLDDLVGSYNIKTNNWGKHYVYKRFAFIGNKQISSLINLTFLSIWHGFHVGYPISFYFEFVLFVLQGILKYWFKPLNQYMNSNLEINKTLSFRIQYFIYHVICNILTIGSISYPLMAFDLLTWNKIRVAYNHVYWIGHVIALIMISTHIIILKIKSSSKKRLINENSLKSSGKDEKLELTEESKKKE
ncbi:MBOAT-domain-containing protein [Piromyces finnis]|uniref:Lysophospholipid acyltransferase 5 n=1 Tax=Piromyces finnis TaxID=1754191 RepID=A0A1Y1V3A6_9FUNG|nr:MBOAT-domain-containing protein [Piromyces finnis]|eukprot:ORX45449.1 MBOAT-domain-containing protein [Piromyces finnis]